MSQWVRREQDPRRFHWRTDYFSTAKRSSLAFRALLLPRPEIAIPEGCWVINRVVTEGEPPASLPSTVRLFLGATHLSHLGGVASAHH